MIEKTLSELKEKKLKIEIFGMGYVGLPLAIKLAISGLKVIGIDTNPERIERLKIGTLFESELNLKHQFLECRQRENLIFEEHPKTTKNSKVGIICVTTPIPSQGNDSNFFVNSAIENFVNTCKKGDILILESSIEVGTTDKIQKLIESKGFKVGEDFGLAFCPERIDPQNKKWKLENIPRVIYCSDDTTFKIAQNLYFHINHSNLVRVKSSKIAEVVKSFENTFRLVNISLVNELAILCEKIGINVTDVIDATSTKPFGFMPFYTGAGAGGHCIPKDPTFLLESSKKLGINFRTIENAIQINSFMPTYIANSIEKLLNEQKLEKSVVVCGLAYKPDTEDMRDSPGFKILNELNKKGIKCVGYDPFFKNELIKKYLIENHLKDFKLDVLEDLNQTTIQKFNCLCIVQHHTKIKFRLEEIYKNSQIPLVYDCQNKLKIDSNSHSILKSLGS